MGTTAGNILAQRNGRMVEKLLLGHTVSSHHVTDRPKYDIKSVQEWVRYKGNTSGRRPGSFVFYNHQHEVLLKKNGWYLLNVLDEEGHIKMKKKIPASVIEAHFHLLEMGKQRTILHTTLFNV